MSRNVSNSELVQQLVNPSGTIYILPSGTKLVDISSTQTLTNKTLSAAILSNGIMLSDATSSYMPTLLSRYQLLVLTVNVSGLVYSNTTNIVLTLVGNLVTAYFIKMTNGGNSTVANMTFDTNIPALFRPIISSTAVTVPILVTDAGTQKLGYFSVDENGVMTIYSTGATITPTTFTSTISMSGYDGFSVSWIRAVS
jgi:hypothetical protein